MIVVPPTAIAPATADLATSSRVVAVRERPTGIARAWTMVLLLTLLNITAFVDRYVMTLMVGEFHRDFAISDIQFGILVGPAFIVTYVVALFPIATLVDRFNRQLLILAGVTLWSAMTIATAYATSFPQLVMLRAGLAIGEAVISPAAISLVGDLFMPAKRRLPMIAIVAGAQLGVAAAALFGAFALDLVSRYGSVVPGWLPNTPWRLVFIAVGLLPVLVGGAYFLISREPARGGFDAPVPVTVGDISASRAHVRAYWPLYLMAAAVTSCTALVGTLIPVWAPTFVHRTFGVSAAEAGYALGSAFMIASFSGVIAFPALLRYLSRSREVTRGMVLVCVAGIIIGLPAFLLACSAYSFPMAVVAFGVASFAFATTFPLTTQIVQIHTPAIMRARVGAAMVLLLFFVASGIGPVAVPGVARLLRDSQALGAPLIIVGTIGSLVGLAACWWLDRWLRRTLVAGLQGPARTTSPGAGETSPI